MSAVTDSKKTSQDLFIELLKKALTASLYEESAWKIIESQPTLRPSTWQISQRLKNTLQRFIVNQLKKRSLILVRKNKYNRDAREEGSDWPCFGFTMIGHRRLDNLEKCIKDVISNDIPGDFIETGAWRGGATIFMRAMLETHGVTDRHVWVADSFEGLPIPAGAQDGWDLSHVEHLAASVESVKCNFEKFGLLDDHVRFLVGWFKNTLPNAPITKLAILRLDGDLYSSTYESLSSLYPKVSNGGYVIVDDYFSWPACKQAVNDYLLENKLQVKIIKIDNDGAYWKVTDEAIV